MGLLIDSLLAEVLIAAATLLTALYCYLTATYDYWQKRGVPYVKPTPIFGNLMDQMLFKKNLMYVIQDIYNALDGTKFGGYFESRTPVLMLRDKGLIEQILIKDFSYFSNRDVVADLQLDPLAGNLFGLKGQMWRNLRNKLTPTFTTGKLKGMLEQLCNCGTELLEDIEVKITKGEVVDAKKIGATFSIDVIASCAFGLQFKANSPEGIQFRKMIDRVFKPSILRMIHIMMVVFFKSLAKTFKVRQFPKELNEYTINLVKTTMAFREKNNIQRNDFLQLMMNLRAQEDAGVDINWKSELSEEDAYLNQLDYVKDNPLEKGIKVMSDECIAAQSFVFLTGGSEALANAISFTLYELAINPEVQTRLQLEVDQVLAKSGGRLTYQALKDMAYLDLVIQERNRKYSEGLFLQRVCEARYTIPGTEVVVEPGTRINVPLFAIHNDPVHYPEPDKFIPERFEGNNHRSSGIYLPFGDGPRVCIAMRFVIYELKTCIAQVMSKYSVTLDSKTKVPLKFNPKSFSLTPDGGIWVNFHRRKNFSP